MSTRLSAKEAIEQLKIMIYKGDVLSMRRLLDNQDMCPDWLEESTDNWFIWDALKDQAEIMMGVRKI